MRNLRVIPCFYKNSQSVMPITVHCRLTNMAAPIRRVEELTTAKRVSIILTTLYYTILYIHIWMFDHFYCMLVSWVVLREDGACHLVHRPRLHSSLPYIYIVRCKILRLVSRYNITTYSIKHNWVVLYPVPELFLHAKALGGLFMPTNEV